MEINVREAGNGDIPELCRLSNQLGYRCTENLMAKNLREIQMHKASGVFVADDGSGTLVGWVQFTIPLFLYTDSFLEITGFVVDEKVRSQGIGAALLHIVENWAETQAIKKVVVHSNVKRLDAHRFYEKNGYKIIKSQQLFEKNIVPASLPEMVY